MAGIVHKAQDVHLCALFIEAHGKADALDAANSAAGHLQAIQVWNYLPLPRCPDAGILAKFVCMAQRNLSLQRPADNPDETSRLSHQSQRKAERYSIKEIPLVLLVVGSTGEKPPAGAGNKYSP
ncbi:hypothetical protein [Corynebacterium cystitidis]|uniref:hypothetical protein n=1 Tax=Corynebacterium cystitidis TaxID=35757 RepID=UPI00211F345D|nr:hypothetical protein [Corynebacterium cystitidis]